MSDAVGPVVPWGGLLLGGAYVALFLLARRPVSLRLGRLSWLLLVVSACQYLWVLAGWRRDLDFATGRLGDATLLAGLVCFLGRRIWLVRSGAEELRRQLEVASRGLFLQCQEAAPGRFLLCAKGKTAPLRVWRLGARLQLLALPGPGGSGKVDLLVHWLSKQYPGPIPRIRIALQRSEP